MLFMMKSNTSSHACVYFRHRPKQKKDALTANQIQVHAWREGKFDITSNKRLAFTDAVANELSTPSTGAGAVWRRSVA